MLDELVSHPVRPTDAQQLRTLYFSKGINGTTAIEGNSLSAEQIRELLEDPAKQLPPSKKHLQDEVLNVVSAYEYLQGLAQDSSTRIFQTSTVLEAHRLIAQNLDHMPVIPGKIRTGSVIVPPYKPPEGGVGLHQMLDKLGPWLRNERFAEGDFLNGFTRAIVAHVYLAWIHPFDDGNGRVARAIEFAALLATGIPFEGAVLLGNHYNETRSRYYDELRRSSQDLQGDLTRFTHYALEGFRDSLKEAVSLVRKTVFNYAWENYVYDTFRAHHGRSLSGAMARARAVLLRLSQSDQKSFSKHEIADFPEFTAVTLKTVTRDIKHLQKLDLLIESDGLFTANTGVMNTFKLGKPLVFREKPEDSQQLNLLV